MFHVRHDDGIGSNGQSSFQRMSLDEFTKQVPPGWRPGLQRYSFRRYIQKLTLWWRFADVQEHSAGLLIAARLQGLAFEIAVALRIECDGVVHTGDAALALPAIALWKLTLTLA